jgi:hypothetical protein
MVKAYKILKGSIKLESNKNEGRYYKIKEKEEHILEKGDIFVIKTKEIIVPEYGIYTKYNRLKCDFLIKIDKKGNVTEHDIFQPLILLCHLFSGTIIPKQITQIRIEQLLENNYIKEDIAYSRDEKIKEILC